MQYTTIRYLKFPFLEDNKVTSNITADRKRAQTTTHDFKLQKMLCHQEI